jgi:tetratricopeptide (TPR) repeat protein
LIDWGKLKGLPDFVVWSRATDRAKIPRVVPDRQAQTALPLWVCSVAGIFRPTLPEFSAFWPSFVRGKVVLPDRNQKTAGLGLALAAITLIIAALSSGCNLVANGHNAQGVREFQAGNYTAAMQRFQTASRTYPANADAIYNMAATIHRQGLQSSNRDMLSQAEIYYNQALDIDPNHTDAHRGLAVLLVQTDRPDKAKLLLKNWKATSPMVADAPLELARLSQEFGDMDAAKAHLQDAVVLDATNPRVYKAWGYVYEREGDYAQALANYQRSMNLKPDQQVAARIQTLNQVLASGSGSSSGTRTVRANNPGWKSRY